MYDKVPAAVAALAVSAAPVVPGPTKDEWVATAAGLFTLLLRELVWWIRNRGSR